MAATDLDPLFVKALKLLNSKSKESAAQLKAMLDEAIAQRKGLKVPAQGGDAGKMSPARSKGDDDYKKKDVDKRSLEKIGKDPSEPDIKKSKLDSKHRSKDEKDARDKEREKEKARRDRKEKEEKEAQRQKEKAEKEKKEKALLISKQENEVTMVSDEDEGASSQLDAGDFALEMGIACVVCKQFGVSSGNQLVECQECHSLYHQECHKPPVAEETVNDPRYVWYCSRCLKILQKKQQQASQKPVTKPTKPSASLISGKDLSASMASSAKPFKTESSSLPLGSIATTNSTSQAFRKIDPKVIVPPKDTNSQSKPILGLAGLAANLTKPQSKSGSGYRKSEQKGGDILSKSSKFDSSKSASKTDSSSLLSKSKTDDKRPEKQSSSSSDKERKYDSGSSKSSSSSSNRDEKKSNSSELFSKTSMSASAFDKSEKKLSESSSKSEKKSMSSEPNKSSASSSGLRLDLPSSSPSSSVSGSRNSPSQLATTEPPESPITSSKLGTGMASSSSDKNKKAMATLSMITANKRMQMMMKKAQAKPSDKKVHNK